MTYSNTTELPLTFTADEFVVATYSLDNSTDNRGSSRLSGNTTLTGLTNGTHTLIVTVYTEIGVVSQTTYFVINGMGSQGFETAIISMIVIVVVVASISLVYFKKRRTAPEHTIERKNKMRKTVLFIFISLIAVCAIAAFYPVDDNLILSEFSFV